MYSLSPVAALCLMASGASAFAPAPYTSKITTALSMASESDRRDFLSKVVIAAAGTVAGTVLTPVQRANALGGGGLSKVNARLSRWVVTFENI